MLNGIFGKKPTVKGKSNFQLVVADGLESVTHLCFSSGTPFPDQQRENDRQLRRAGRDIERERRKLEMEEKKLEAEIKKAAAAGNKEGCALLAKQLIQCRKQKNRTFAANSKITSIGFQNKAMTSNIALTDAIASTSKTMGDMNKLTNPEGIAKNLRDFQRENMKMEMTDEMSKWMGNYYFQFDKYLIKLSPSSSQRHDGRHSGRI